MHGDMRAAHLEGVERGLHTRVDRHVASHDRDAQHFGGFALHRQDQRHSVVARRVGVDPHLLLQDDPTSLRITTSLF